MIHIVQSGLHWGYFLDREPKGSLAFASVSEFRNREFHVKKRINDPRSFKRVGPVFDTYEAAHAFVYLVLLQEFL